MIDNYYDKELMTDQDKALFAFASYNVALGRISRLRKETAKRGLDPTVWFHDVGYVAAERIGAETMTYASNTCKHCIAHRLIMESQRAQKQAMERIEGETKK